MLKADAINYTTPTEFVERNSYFFFHKPREEYARGLGDGMLTKNASTVTDNFRKLLPEQWNEPNLKKTIEELALTLSTKWGQGCNERVDLAKASRASVQHFLRWALTGGRPGPTLMLAMNILGRDLSLERIEDAVMILEKMTLEANGSSND